MSFFAHVFDWFTTASNWTGPNGIPELFWRQLTLSAAVVFTAIVIGGGLGVFLGHSGRGGLVAVNAATRSGQSPRWPCSRSWRSSRPSRSNGVDSSLRGWPSRRWPFRRS